MKLSIYTHLFCRDGKWYLYNSETGFFSTLHESAYEALYNGDFEILGEETVQILREKRIIVDEEHLYDYYYASRLSYLSTIGYQKSLNLTIAPTTGCNFACPYCFEGEKGNKVMSQDTINDLIAFINSYEESDTLNITWYGGEPLCAFGTIKEILKRIENDCRCKIGSQSIVTNGYLINEEIIDFMKRTHFNSIQISLDGTEKHHNETRFVKGSKNPTFERIMDNLDLLAGKMPKSFCISLRINVNKNNEDDYANMYKFIREKYPDKDNIVVYPGFIREPNKSGSAMCYKCLFGNDRYAFWLKAVKQGVPDSLYPQKTAKGCMTSQNNSLVIGPEGEIYKCWNDVNHPEKVVGYIKDKRMTNPQLICHYAFEATLFNDPKCKNCKLFPICDGGCGWMRYENVINGKEYDICSYLSNINNLEECLLNYSQTQENVIAKQPIC